MNRREFIRSLIVTSVLVATTVAGIEEITRLADQTPIAAQSITQDQQTTSEVTTGSTSQQSASSAPAGYVFIAQASILGGKNYAYFTHPNQGSSIFVNVNGTWKAFSAICTHRICTVQYQGSSIYCPCHGATFSPNNGSVTAGPPPSPLPEYGVQVLNNNLYVSINRIN